MRHSLSLFRRSWLPAVALLLLAGCTSLPTRRAIVPTGDPVVDGKANLAIAPAKDRVLWEYRIAAAALRLGRFEEARIQLESALPLISGVMAQSAEAAKARSLFGSESEKIFLGEPYERVMAYYYRAILYWQEGQPDNARACYRSGQLIDSDAESAAYQSDYVLLDYLDGLASAKLGADGAEAFARAQKNASRELPPYDPKANVLIFVEYGKGPRKYQGGELREQLKFMAVNSRARSARLQVGEHTVPLPPWDTLSFQASTRGGRVMDYILGNKAVFKQTTDAVGDVALVGAAIASSNIYRPDGRKSHNSENAALALGAIGLISKIASAATTPQADVRTWDNLPEYLSFASLQLPPGSYPARLEFLDRDGRVIPTETRTLSLQVRAEGDTVVFLSEHKR